MNCKSCNNNLKTNDKYCSNCGGKVIHKRLSIKGTWSEFIAPFFSWDTHFFKTFIHLFTKPREVLNAYISGARKKYFKPFPFLIAYATIALFFYKFFPLSVQSSFQKGFELSANSKDNPSEILSKFDFLNNSTTILYDYYNFYIIATIPLFAYTSYLALKKYQNNFAEHLVFQSYLQSMVGYFTIFLQLILIHFLGINHNLYTFLLFSFSVLYGNYLFITNYNLNFKSALIINLKFWSLFLLFAFLIIILVSIVTAIYAINYTS